MDTPELPNDLESERVILGASLLNNDLLGQVTELLGVEDFSLDSHRRTLKAMLNLHNQGMAVDGVTLQADLKARGELERVGGLSCIAALMDGVTRTDTIEYYARIVKRKAVERGVISALNLALTKLLDGEAIEDVLPNVERAAAEATSSSAGGGLRFHTAREIASQTPERPVWIAKPYLARGGITEVDGKIKAAGKTTWITHLCRATLEGKPFMGFATTQTGVVYLSEQPATSFREALRRADLLDRDDFTVLFWHDIKGLAWPDVVRAAVNECKRRGAGVLIVDTLPQFAGMRGDAENSSGEALAAVKPLQEAAAIHGLAVVIIRHERKGGGDVGDSGRGSSAFAGAVDIVLSIRRGDGNSSPNLRIIHALSRFDETPDTLVIELRDGAYVALGSETAVAVEQALKAILDILPGSAEAALTMNEIVEKADLKRTVAQDAVKTLLEQRELTRTGTGKKGAPYRYYKSENDSAAPTDEVAAERNGQGGNTQNGGGQDGEIHSAVYKDEVAAESILGGAGDGEILAAEISAQRNGGGQIHSAATSTIIAAESIFDPTGGPNGHREGAASPL